MYERDLASGLEDAPWPPVYPKMPGEPPRVAPSRARKDDGSTRPAASKSPANRKPRAERARVGADQLLRSESAQAAAALTPATASTAGHGPIFLASGCDTPNAP